MLGRGDAVRKADPESDAHLALPPAAGTLLAGENAESALANEAFAPRSHLARAHLV